MLIYERPDDKELGFGSVLSDDGRYLIINGWRGTEPKNNVYYLDLETPAAGVQTLIDTFDATYGFLGNDGPRFYLVTDKDAPRYRIIAVDIHNPAPERWETIIPETQDTLEAAIILQDQFILMYLHDAASVLKVVDTQGRFVQDIGLPSIGTVMQLTGERDQTTAYYLYTDFATPAGVYAFDLTTGESQPFRVPTVGFDSADYVTTQVFYPSKDGTQIPMFICHHKDVQPSAETPVWLYGYGGFNIPNVPTFSLTKLVWMENGGVYAQACLRGGGEYGRAWHEAGMRLKRQNVFDDFIAAGEWLIANGYTSTPKLAINGGSNGGLLVGACLTQRPELFGAAIPQVGVLDMLRFTQFTIGWAWVSDYGTPENADEFKVLYSYSPYHNTKPAAYPPTLITTADHDDRVFPAHSFKFTAALQAAQQGDTPILARIETRAGHGMGKPTKKVIEEAADILAFLWTALGME